MTSDLGDRLQECRARILFKTLNDTLSRASRTIAEVKRTSKIRNDGRKTSAKLL